MKKYMKEIFKLALTGCMVFGTWFPVNSACLMFFGEYEYPKESDYISR